PGRPFSTRLNPPEVTLKQHGWNQTPSAYGTQRLSSFRFVFVMKWSRLLSFGLRPSEKLLKAVIGMASFTGEIIRASMPVQKLPQAAGSSANLNQESRMEEI